MKPKPAWSWARAPVLSTTFKLCLLIPLRHTLVLVCSCVHVCLPKGLSTLLGVFISQWVSNSCSAWLMKGAKCYASENGFSGFCLIRFCVWKKQTYEWYQIHAWMEFFVILYLYIYWLYLFVCVCVYSIFCLKGYTVAHLDPSTLILQVSRDYDSCHYHKHSKWTHGTVERDTWTTMASTAHQYWFSFKSYRSSIHL